MKAQYYLLGVVVFSLFCASADAQYIVTTNMNGADAEVREDDVNPISVPVFGPVPFGTNRGAMIELATRAKDSTAGTGDRSSAIYLKFDISDSNGVTDALMGLADRTELRLTTRNSAHLRWNRIHHRNPYYGTLPADDTNPDFVEFASNPANFTRISFDIYGLQNFAHPNYNWSESGVPNTWNPVTSPLYGPEGSIIWYNAPGITPDSRLALGQDPGKYNFNGDMRLLGQATLEDPGLPNPVPPPFPPVPGSGSAALCVGCGAINFDDPAGELHNLIEEARLAGQSHVTLAIAFALDAFQNATGETAQVTPNDFLNFSYLFNPKEMDGDPTLAGLQLNNDSIWDADWSDNNPAPGPTPPGPGPFSRANNDGGWFSPQLVFVVPEPASIALMALGFAMVLSFGRKRNN